MTLHRNFPYALLNQMVEVASSHALNRFFILNQTYTRMVPADYAHFSEFNKNGIEFDMIQHGFRGGSDESIGTYTVPYEELERFFQEGDTVTPDEYLYSEENEKEDHVVRERKVAERVEEERQRNEVIRLNLAEAQRKKRHEHYLEMKKEFENL